MADQRYVGEHEIEDPEHLPTLTSVPPKDAVKTTLDESLYGSDELWNQQLFTGGSLASVLDLACTKPTDIKVPLWWGPLISSKEVQGKKGDEKKKQLRRAVFKVIRQKSQLLFMLAKSAERDLTEIMQSIETRSKGKLIGLEYKLKYLTSVQRKLIFECVGNPQKSVSEVMNTRMTDTLRYTIQYPTNQYCKCAKLMVDTLVDEKGYKSFEIRNYWETGHAYDGLNCSFQTDDYEAGGILFEVQVHTLESFRVKQYESHVLYELWRGVDHPQRKYMIFTQMVDLFDSVPRPPGDLMSIGVLNRKTCPEPPGYKAWIKDNKHELQRLKDKKYDTFGVSVDHVSAPEEMTTVVVDSESPRQAGTVIGNPMNSDGLGGDAGETGCLAKFWQSVSGCCSQKPSDQSETLMVSQMRDDPAKHVNPMFESTGAPRQDRFAFIRHGEAEHNVLFRAGKIEEGIQILDPPLTAKGRRQSEALCKYIEAERMSFDYAVVSCLSRALETCEIVFRNAPSTRVIVTSLSTETSVDDPENDRVGGPCRSGLPLDELKARFTNPKWDWSALEDPTLWAKKSWLENAAPGVQGWCHPKPKEDRISEFKAMLLGLPNASSKVAVVGHSAFFKSFVQVKMTSCQMYNVDNLD